jgi:hypothetical protein
VCGGARARLLLASLLLLLAAAGATALPVPEATARRVAQNLIRQHVLRYGGWGGSLTPTIVAVTRVDLAGDPLAFNVTVAPSGHVLVGGDDELSAVLLYSDVSAFDPSKAADAGAFEGWIVPEVASHVARLKALARQRQAGARPPGWEATRTGQSWRHFDVPEGEFRPRGRRSRGESEAAATLAETAASAETASKLDPLLTTTWEQEPPYNNYMPSDLMGCRTKAGCVAVATAQIMARWKWPLRGTGSPSYKWYYFWPLYDTLSANLDHVYDWDLMPNDLGPGVTADQIDAVARLISDVAIANKMDFGCNGSSAHTSYSALTVLPTYFGYQTPHQVSRRDYPNATQFFALIQAELDAATPRPMLMDVRTTDDKSGHAVVIDGYDTASGDLAHVNLGWGAVWQAQYRGYYNINNDWTAGFDWSANSQVIYTGLVPSPLSVGTPATVSSIGQTSATVSATVSPNGGAMSVVFEYGLTTSYGMTTTAQIVDAGTAAVTVTNTLAGLTCGTVYHFRPAATNFGGATTGADGILTTSACGVPTTLTVTWVTPASGPTTGSTPVTVTGTNFATGATVQIGGIAATSVSVVNSTTITATTGPHAAGVADVVVTNAGGMRATLARGFTYVTPLPANTLYANTASGQIYSVDTTTGVATLRATTAVTNLTDITFVGTQLYGVSGGGGNSGFYSINLASGSAMLIGWTGVFLNALAASADGTVYASGTVSGFSSSPLYTVDRLTGTLTLVGYFGGNLVSAGDLSFDASGQLWASAIADQGTGVHLLVRVNKNSGVATAGPTCPTTNVFGLAFRGGILYGATGAGEFLTINPATGEGSLVAHDPSKVWYGMAVSPDDTPAPASTLYANTGSGQIYSLDTTTGVATLRATTTLTNLTDITFVGTQLYGVSGGGANSGFYSINLASGTAKLIGSTGVFLNALATSADGTVYASGTVSGLTSSPLYTVDRLTGTLTLVGYFGGNLVSAGDLSFDASGQLWASAIADQGTGVDVLVRVNKNSGVATAGPAFPATNVFGLAFNAGILYGVTKAGEFWTINPTTGEGFLVAQDPSKTWYGMAPSPTVLTLIPVIAWGNPSAITYGTPLGARQLAATADTAGAFAYTPPAGTVLSVGRGHTLSVIFTPADATNYAPATKSVTIDVKAPAPTFTDTLLQPRSSPVKRVHVTELRQAIEALRTWYGLAASVWTDPTIVARLTPAKAAHVTELRTALDEVYVAAGRTAPTYTHAPVTGGATVITAMDIVELRAAILAIW